MYLKLNNNIPSHPEEPRINSAGYSFRLIPPHKVFVLTCKDVCYSTSDHRYRVNNTTYFLAYDMEYIIVAYDPTYPLVSNILVNNKETIICTKNKVHKPELTSIPFYNETVLLLPNFYPFSSAQSCFPNVRILLTCLVTCDFFLILNSF